MGTKKVRPIRPTDLKEKVLPIPDVMIDIINGLIRREFRDGKATFNKGELMELLADDIQSEDADRYGWWNFDALYRFNGWDVSVKDGRYTFIPERKTKPERKRPR